MTRFACLLPAAPLLFPATDRELVGQYRPYVSKLVHSVERISGQADDALSAVWCGLLGDQVIHSYVASCLPAPPETMSAIESCQYIGITWSQWTGAHTRTRAGRADMPAPIDWCGRGSGRYSRAARYRLNDILPLADVDEPTFRIRGRQIGTDGRVVEGSGPTPPPQIEISRARHFKNYLRRAVRSRHQNFWRGETRRHKERPVSVRSDDTEREHWEATVPDTSASSEMQMQLSRARATVGSVLGADAHSVWSALSDGMSLRLALRHHRVPAARQRAVSRALGLGE